MSNTPRVGDPVSVDIEIDGHLLFQNLNGSIRLIDQADAEIAATLPVGDVPLTVPVSTLEATGSGSWRLIARAYMRHT